MAILVIADDLTGAAEIAGIAWRYGLSVEIVHSLAEPTTKEILVLNTNTRSLKADEVIPHLRMLLATDHAEQWDWIYLKFDSALRGHIVTEISFYRLAFQKDNVFFCPVNLSLDRIIRNGEYWVEGKPIADTDFARDPEFPIQRSSVLEAIGAAAWELAEEVPTKPDKDQPFTVAAVANKEALNRWATLPTAWGLYAGAAAFFEALLDRQIGGFSRDKTVGPLPKPPLFYVCGSNHIDSVQRVKSLDPEAVVYWQQVGQEDQLANLICEKMNKKGKVVLAVEPSRPVKARTVRQSMARVVTHVEQSCGGHELLIEGGATARAVLEALQIHTLRPVWEYEQGVLRTVVPERTVTITLKPGSYPWAEKLWMF